MERPQSRTMPGLLAEMAGRLPDHDFLIDGERRFTYAAFLAETRRVARGLHAIGVGRGSRVALLMGNRAEWLLAAFATTMLGGTVVALNTWWKSRELAHALTLSDTSVLVMETRFLAHDYSAEIAAIGPLPLLRHKVAIGADPLPGAMDWAALLAAGADVPETAVTSAAASVLPEDPAYILFTSGSTARSKAVPLLHGGLVGNMHGIGERMHLTERDRLLMTVSMFCVLTHGGSIVLQHHFDPAEALALIERERCSVLYTMPNMVLALHGHPDRARRDLSSLRTGLGMPHSLPLMAEMGAAEMTVCYGLTEGYGNSAVADCKLPLAVKSQISGTALPSTELEVVDPTTHRPLPPGEVGEFRIRGYVTPGYLKDPEKTRETIDDEGWLYTGDLGFLDATGGVHFRGRSKEMVRSGGINISPAEVEEVLQSHPAVQQAIVVGVPDPERDEVLAAMVVPKPGHAVTSAELVAHCRGMVAAFKVPRLMELVAAGQVPLTDTGKISKRLIQDRFAQRHGKG
jgi:fatty-acyl-CoA synthase